ncbi:unnamed protein product, partial [Closterium sp. NIES-54]
MCWAYHAGCLLSVPFLLFICLMPAFPNPLFTASSDVAACTASRAALWDVRVSLSSPAMLFCLPDARRSPATAITLKCLVPALISLLPFSCGSVTACTASRAALWDVRASLSSPAMLFRFLDTRQTPDTTTTFMCLVRALIPLLPFPHDSVTACTTSRAALWDVRASLSSPAMLFRLPDARRSPATAATLKCLAPDPDASVIYGGCSDGAICAWDLRQGTGHLGNNNSFPHFASSSLQQSLPQSFTVGESRKPGASNHPNYHQQQQRTVAAATVEATASFEASQESSKKGMALIGAQVNGSSGRIGKGNAGLIFGGNGRRSGGESEGISGAVEGASGVTEKDGRGLVEEGLLAEVERDIDRDLGVVGGADKSRGRAGVEVRERGELAAGKCLGARERVIERVQERATQSRQEIVDAAAECAKRAKSGAREWESEANGTGCGSGNVREDQGNSNGVSSSSSKGSRNNGSMHGSSMSYARSSMFHQRQGGESAREALEGMRKKARDTGTGTGTSTGTGTGTGMYEGGSLVMMSIDKVFDKVQSGCAEMDLGRGAFSDRLERKFMGFHRKGGASVGKESVSGPFIPRDVLGSEGWSESVWGSPMHMRHGGGVGGGVTCEIQRREAAKGAAGAARGGATATGTTSVPAAVAQVLEAAGCELTERERSGSREREGCRGGEAGGDGRRVGMQWHGRGATTRTLQQQPAAPSLFGSSPSSSSSASASSAFCFGREVRCALHRVTRNPKRAIHSNPRSELTVLCPSFPFFSPSHLPFPFSFSSIMIPSPSHHHLPHSLQNGTLPLHLFSTSHLFGSVPSLQVRQAYQVLVIDTLVTDLIVIERFSSDFLLYSSDSRIVTPVPTPHDSSALFEPTQKPLPLFRCISSSTSSSVPSPMPSHHEQQQAGTTSSAVQHLSFDPASASRLSFHLNNGWSGVLHVPSLSLSHIHCPPPPWVNTQPEVEEDERLYEYDHQQHQHQQQQQQQRTVVTPPLVDSWTWGLVSRRVPAWLPLSVLCVPSARDSHLFFLDLGSGSPHATPSSSSTESNHG